MTSMATRLRRALRHAKVRFYALIARTSIRMPTCRAQTTPDAVPLPITSACAKCGTSTKSGKSSCCSPGGDWFGDCADEVDENYGHTWAEGIKACRCKFHKHHCRGENASVRLYAQILTHHSPTPVLSDLSIETSISSPCSTCGKVEGSGNSSCCAPGGDWFGDCGGEGDIAANYSHTWSEGIEVCIDSHRVDAAQHQQSNEDDVHMETIAMDTGFRASNLFAALAYFSVFVILV